MKRKPNEGESLRLFAYAQKSRSGFSVPVTCCMAHDSRDTFIGKRPLAGKFAVQVRLPDGETCWVQRDDLEPLA